MAFAAVTILMDTLHQHFLQQPTPRFPLRNKTEVRLLYNHLSSLQTSLEQDFKVGDCDEAIKGLEAQMRDACIELRFQIEHQLALFYLGKSMKLRLESAKKLLPILRSRAIEEETMDFDSVMEMIRKHFTLPVSRMSPHLEKRVRSFCTQLHPHFLYGGKEDEKPAGGSEDEWETDEEAGKSDDDEEWETDEEGKVVDEVRRYMLCEAESIIRQELRAPSYLNKYMKQRIEARQRIRQLFIQGIKLTSYLKEEVVLKVKNAAYNNNQSKTSQENTTFGDDDDDSLHHTSSVSFSTIKMVGCDDEFNMILDKLKQQSKQREIVPIMGMGGIGKTTLARRIYGDDLFISRFDCRAWVTISQDYNPTKVFEALLRSLAPEEDYEENNELAERVCKCVKGRRYLIVIDDIWSPDVLDDLMRCFQDENNGSRMLLTTRLKNVADYATSGTNSCHTMRFLDSYESWKLFRNKMFSQKITLSPEFERIGREIVKKCKGLPLAITVAAGLLSNSKQDLNEWERIAKNVHTLSLGGHSNQQGENIIDLSYTFLPHHLKLCFFSFGSFKEDQETPEYFIVDIWVREGFLKVSRSKSLEHVARESLQDLVDRNLLNVREMNGGLHKTYQIHDVLRELALREAQKENLLCVNSDTIFGFGFRRRRIQRINSSSSSSSSSSCSISQPWSIQSKSCSYNSATVFHTYRIYSPLNFRYSKFKFLRGLGMMGETKDFNATGFVGLVHLRWLSSDCIFNLHSLPWFMLRNLRKLEVERSLEMASIDEPLNIWGLPQLKILIIEEGLTLVPPTTVHHNLEIIKYLNYMSCTKELFMRIPNVRTLAVREVNLKCEASDWFESLAYLYKLEVLEVQGKLLQPMFSTFRCMETLSIEKFLPNLKQLKLRKTELSWEDMFVVGMLSKLEVLIILKDGVVGRIWEPKDGGFCGLKFLGIFDCGLQYWEVTGDHFPVLERLVLGRMHLLERIPTDFADILTLKSIKLFRCFKSAISSAKDIQEEQREYGNDTLIVDILGIGDFYSEFFKAKGPKLTANLEHCGCEWKDLGC